MWSRALHHALADFGLGDTITAAEVERWFESGFPWQRLEHPELDTADKWWREVTDRIEALVSSAKVPHPVAIEIAAAARRAIINPGDYRVFDDVVSTLRFLGSHGFRHVIVSNHIPELHDLVAALGLGTFFEAVVTSGRVGYEKPDPRLFMVALEGIDRVGPVWSIGDSVIRDCLPARELGIDALLVRTADKDYRPQAADLSLAAKIIIQELGLKLASSSPKLALE